MDVAILVRALENVPDSMTLYDATRQEQNDLKVEILLRFRKLKNLTAGEIRLLARTEPEVLHSILLSKISPLLVK